MVERVKTDEGFDYRCDIDGTVLWVRYDNGYEEPRCSCSHFQWEEIGNGCYPIMTDPHACRGIDWIIRNAEKVIRRGTSYYFLVPRLRHYD